MIHVKKCHPGPFAALRNGTKTFEYRKEDDCAYCVGDELMLMEFVVETDKDHTHVGYTGEHLRKRVTYAMRGKYGVPNGYVVLSLANPTPATR